MAGNLKWFFETTKNMVAGANDPIHETFRAFPYYSIVRESLQNSIDAVSDRSRPVKVRFEVLNIDQKDFPSLFKIREHIEACLDMHKGDGQAEVLYNNMLDYLAKNQNIKILKVADYNTTGMPYTKDDVNCPFVSFVRAEGKSAKSSGSGGSFGFGKGAYYVLSEIRTLLVSTMTEKGDLFFEGKTRLASHNLDGEHYGKDGFFNVEETNPVTDYYDIPEFFRRNEQGTDVFILGLLEDQNSGEQMIKSVLNNFWFAVHENLLTVEIKTDDKDIQLTSANLDKLINEYFPDEKEGSVNDIFNWNPKAYYKAVKHAGEADHFMKFEADPQKYKMLKGVAFYLYRHEGLMNRTSYMRKPAMVVQKITNNIISGYAGVFICKDDEGDELLRQMENAAHNQWKVENVRNGTPEMKSKSETFMREMKSFIKETLVSLSSVDDSTRLEVDGLADYLFIPEELIDQTETAIGDAGNEEMGTFSEDPTDIETGSQTTTSTGATTFRSKVIKPVQVADGSGDNPNTGRMKNGGAGGGPKGGKSDKKRNQGKNLLPITYRVASTFEKEKVFHHLIITSEKEVTNVNLKLVAGTDNGKDVELQVLNTDKGTANMNIVSGVHLVKGKNQMKVEFNDNLKHSVKLIAYETI